MHLFDCAPRGIKPTVPWNPFWGFLGTEQGQPEWAGQVITLSRGLAPPNHLFPASLLELQKQPWRVRETLLPLGPGGFEWGVTLPAPSKVDTRNCSNRNQPTELREGCGPGVGFLQTSVGLQRRAPS